MGKRGIFIPITTFPFPWNCSSYSHSRGIPMGPMGPMGIPNTDSSLIQAASYVIYRKTAKAVKVTSTAVRK